jgi:hypothetical protein
VNIPAKSPEADEEKSPWHREIPTYKEVFIGELAERGDWIVANIQTGSFWPVNAQKVMHRGHVFWIIPVMREYYPAVAMKVPPGKNRAECEELVMRFVSNLSWVEDRGITVDGIGGGHLPRPMGRDKWCGFSHLGKPLMRQRRSRSFASKYLRRRSLNAIGIARCTRIPVARGPRRYPNSDEPDELG